MAPSYSRSQNRRQNRTGLVDHDVYEGLPVRQWRRDFVTVAPPPSQESTTSQNDIWAVELPHGMPKDSHMLSQHSQDLLRAARSGKIYKRPVPVEEEEADPEIVLGDKPEKKDEDLKDKGFMAKAWKQIPRHMEASDVEYLAKRRKGLITVAARASAPGPTLIKTTVKRTDAVGNEYVQDLVIPQGQHVDGEVIAQTIIPDPGTTDSLVQPTLPKRKGPVPRKKVKGPGRGRKKKAAAPTSMPAMAVDGANPVAATIEGAVGPDGVNLENDSSVTSNQNEDIEMGDGSNLPSDDDDDGDEGDESDEGEIKEGSEDNTRSPSKALRQDSPVAATFPTMKLIPNISGADTFMSGTEPLRSPILPADQERTEKLGSPLKNIALTTSTLNSPLEQPTTSQITMENIASLEQKMLEEVAESAPSELPLPPPEPTIKEEVAAVEILREEEEEEEMLLDIIDNSTKSSELSPPPAETNSSKTPEPKSGESPQMEERASDQDTKVESAQPALDDDDDDDFPDLLGGLEKSLEKKHS